MKSYQIQLNQNDSSDLNFPFTPDLFFVFGSREFLENEKFIPQLKQSYPDALFTGCSTSGEIIEETVHEDSVVITAVKFDKTSLSSACIDMSAQNSFEGGKALIEKLPKEELKHVFIISDGIVVNGTDLVKGATDQLGNGISITGGLAGDAAKFEKTVVVCPDGSIQSEMVSAIGFHGESLEVGFGSRGGWESFGMERKVTKSEGNVLHEIDNEPALKLYKSFLGQYADKLPGSALMFPLSMRTDASERPVVRTILGVNEEDQSLTFAGDIPQNSLVQLMKSNAYKLIDGAQDAALATRENIERNPEFAVLISCVGRRLVIKQMIDDEVEVVKEELGSPSICGFYSYGELAPFDAEKACELHNQTMTITTFCEK